MHVNPPSRQRTPPQGSSARQPLGEACSLQQPQPHPTSQRLWILDDGEQWVDRKWTLRQNNCNEEQLLLEEADSRG